MNQFNIKYIYTYALRVLTVMPSINFGQKFLETEIISKLSGNILVLSGKHFLKIF